MIPKRSVWAVLVLVAGAATLGGVGLHFTNLPRFCATCHTVAPSYDSWLVSSHKDVTCVDCHVRDTVQGWLHDKAYAGTKDVLITLFGAPTAPHNLDSTVVSETCIACHREILRVSEVAPRDLPAPVKDVGLIMSHRKHMGAFVQRGQGEGCTTCHSRVVHGTPVKGYPIVVPRGHVEADNQPYEPSHPKDSVLYRKAMADCFRCHDGKTEHAGKVLSRKCETCHLPDKVRDLLF
ncbi:hypothetical protein YTPLAS18_26770 [Nitrospira sp.]|nr:hypothetical protein YTPLAS18_26770 [Nitrospira sp.]